MAQCWLRQRAQDAEARYFRSHDVLDAIATDFKIYQTVPGSLPSAIVPGAVQSGISRKRKVPASVG